MAAAGDSAAIKAARGLMAEGTVAPATPINRLDNSALGWLFSSMLFAWIRVRAEQATARGMEIEQALCVTGLTPEPWDAGAVDGILSDLGAIEGIDWDLSVGRWPKEMVVRFLLAAFDLIRNAMAARDVGGGIGNQSPEIIARTANAAAGNPLMLSDEVNDLFLGVNPDEAEPESPDARD